MGFEWIPYDQFDDVKEISKNNLVISYSAMWKNGPLYWRSWNEYKRVPYKTVVLKYLAVLRNGPLCYNLRNQEYKRNPNDTIALRCLGNSRVIENLNDILKEYLFSKELWS
ncbi:kinase-like domain-containing protein [Rhizophagus clarus]|uniref:Kinase-like domain-containing protein n=1 Tax=Rhizophagus clarus TaxID=94130 RepID=A0A8H3MDN5_9GLOM|nr:kinase-like domain-containing protein [Rhizophagus clarus]